MFKVQMHADGVRKVAIIESITNEEFKKIFGADGMKTTFGASLATTNLQNYYTATGKPVPKGGPELVVADDPARYIDLLNDIATGAYVTGSAKLLKDVSSYTAAVCGQILLAYGPAIEAKGGINLKDLIETACEEAGGADATEKAENGYQIVVSVVEQVLNYQSEDTDESGVAALELGNILKFDASALIPVAEPGAATQTVEEATQTTETPTEAPAETPAADPVAAPEHATEETEESKPEVTATAPDYLAGFKKTLLEIRAISILADKVFETGVSALNEAEVAHGLPASGKDALAALPTGNPVEEVTEEMA